MAYMFGCQISFVFNKHDFFTYQSIIVTICNLTFMHFVLIYNVLF